MLPPVRQVGQMGIPWFLCVLLVLLGHVQQHPLLMTVSASSVLVDSALPKITVSLLGNLHYDPLFGRPGGYGVCNQDQFSLATPGCDSPLNLISSAIQDVSSWNANFTFITGGLLRHGMDSVTTHEMYSMMEKVLELLAASSRKNHPRGLNSTICSMQLALGGTDFSPADTFTPDVRQTEFQQFISFMFFYGLVSYDEHAKMSSCGFYYRDLVDVKLRVISLNTLLWSTALQPPLGVGDVDPCGQFPFLHNAIKQAKQRDRSVIILGDVPPVLNVGDALRKKSVMGATYYWREDFCEAYFRIITSYRFTVSAQFFGHVNTFGFVTSSELGPPMFFVPPISAVMGNNPSYLRVTLESKTGRVVSVRQRHLAGNDTWVEGDSLEDVVRVPLRSMNELWPKDYLQIVQNEDQWERFAAMRTGGRFLTGRRACGVWCRRVIACASLYYKKTAIDHCASLDLPSQNIGLILAIVSTGFSVFAIFVTIVYMLMHSRVLFGPPVVLDMLKRRQRLFPGCAGGL